MTGKRRQRTSSKKKTIGVIPARATGVVKPDSMVLIDDTNAEKFLPVVVDASNEHTDKYRVVLRRAAVIRLRASGVPYDEIVQRLKADDMVAPLLPEKYGTHDAYTDVQVYLRYLRDELAESVPDVVALEVQRFDTALAAIWDQVKAGNIRAIDTMLKISERRSKLLGLDSSIKVDWKIEIINLIESGMVSVDDVRTELGDILYEKFIQYVEERRNERSNISDRAVATIFQDAPGFLSTRLAPTTIFLDQ